MLVLPGTVVKLLPFNVDRNYLGIQNLNSIGTNYIYLLQKEAENEVFINHGLVVGGMGFFEIPHCNSLQSKKEWFIYTSVVGGVDVRVIEI